MTKAPHHDGWECLGRVLEPSNDVGWLRTHAGAAAALPRADGETVDVLVTGRDERNRSLIGRVELRLGGEPRIVAVDPEPLLGCGELGAFDENGVSYPCLVPIGGGRLRLYYTGWMPTVLTPFQNHLGAAEGTLAGGFRRCSRAPILERTDAEPFSTGSAWVLREEGRWRLWYTAFLGWGSDAGEEVRHRYRIQYAESDDGLGWRREGRVAIDFAGPDEFAVARPTVLRDEHGYHMWFCARGERYVLGHARSPDGLEWKRSPDGADLPPSGQRWDDEERCYPCAFDVAGWRYLLYSGNGYGRGGMGLARRRL